jgi:hypothetical protein
MRVLYLIGALFSLLDISNQAGSAATIAPCIGQESAVPPFDVVAQTQTCSLYEIAPGDDGTPPMQQLLFRTLTGYLVLCITTCDSLTSQKDTAQWSDVVAFQNGPNVDQAFVQIFPAPFTQDFLTMVLPCVSSLPECVLPDGTQSSLPLTRFQKKQTELTVYIAGGTFPKAILASPGGPLGGFGANTFNIISAAAPEPETLNQLLFGFTVIALARGLRRDHRRRHASPTSTHSELAPSASSDLR